MSDTHADAIGKYDYPDVEVPMPTIEYKPELIEVSSYKRSTKLDKLLPALCKAQLEFGAVTKDAENVFFSKGGRRSMYATLDSVVKATRTPLAKNGLVIISLPQEMVDNRCLRITSVLFHESEQYIETTIIMPAVDRVSPQELGKLITYARRYQVSALTGVAPEDDDDGNSASGSTGSKEEAQAVGQAKIEALKASKSEAALFYALQPSGQYAITGDQDLMRKIYKQFRKEFHEDKEGRFYMLSDEQLEVLKFQCEQSQIPLQLLKGPKE